MLDVNNYKLEYNSNNTNIETFMSIKNLESYVECLFMLLMNQDYFSLMLNDILVYTSCFDNHDFFFFHNFRDQIVEF